MALINVRDVTLTVGGECLLDAVNLPIARNERACLVGRNGCGKSSLLKMLAGELTPDRGEILRAPALRTAYLPQEIPVRWSGKVRTLVTPPPESAHGESWAQEQRAAQTMSRLRLDPEAAFETLSGGMQRRVLLARALADDPDVLLLDEPTNHLDIEAIEWLEGYLSRPGVTLIFVTHDRAFLRRLATRILDLDRGMLAGWDCDYDTFLRRKQQLMEDEAAIWEKKGRRLTREEIWIRQGIKARRTRDEGRVRALQALREQFRKRRHAEGVSRFQLQTAAASGDLVVKAENLSFAYPGQPPLIRDLDLRVQRGERIGIIGPNGSGKTTLLKLVTGALTPGSGSLTLGTRLEIVYFDQLRSALDGEKTIAQNVAGDGDRVTVGGQSRHVVGYLQDFLFTPDRARTRVKVLSGGERNRVLLAMMFLRPCNLLIMDEPTNDLDLETLDLLEEQLQRHAPTLLLVSHDRAFLNHVVTSVLVFTGDGRVQAAAGGYDDWLARRPAPVAVAPPPAAAAPPAVRRPSYQAKRAMDRLGRRIEALEAEQAQMAVRQADPAFYRQPSDVIVAAQKRAGALAREIDECLERWVELA
jgi:ABC transport system ATP-binding/permease protein